ncbi:MAG: hypothetical protein R2911_12235 [Caldilineaceae bacterium]
MRIVFYINDSGYPDVGVFDGNPILATFLINEIGSTPSNADDWMNEIKKGLDNSYYYSSGTGNAHTLTVKGTNVQISNEFVFEDTDVECSGEQLLHLIELWLSFLEDRQERNVLLAW